MGTNGLYTSIDGGRKMFRPTDVLANRCFGPEEIIYAPLFWVHH